MPETLQDIIETATQLTILFTPFAIVLLYFFWNMGQLLLTVGDAEKKKQARDRMVWSVIALFVVFSLGGIIHILQQTFFGQTN